MKYKIKHNGNVHAPYRAYALTTPALFCFGWEKIGTDSLTVSEAENDIRSDIMDREKRQKSRLKRGTVKMIDTRDIEIDTRS